MGPKLSGRGRVSRCRFKGVIYVAKDDGGTKMWSETASGRAQEVVARPSSTVYLTRRNTKENAGILGL